MRPNYFIFMGFLKTSGGEGGPSHKSVDTMENSFCIQSIKMLVKEAHKKSFTLAKNTFRYTNISISKGIF